MDPFYSLTELVLSSSVHVSDWSNLSECTNQISHSIPTIKTTLPVLGLDKILTRMLSGNPEETRENAENINFIFYCSTKGHWRNPSGRRTKKRVRVGSKFGPNKRPKTSLFEM